MQLCPRCRTLLSAGDGALLEDVCGACHGRFLPAAATERVVVEELGVDRATLKEIAELFSGLRVPCPGCTTAMRPLRLHGVLVDLCFACGGLWLDGGELTSLTAGRYAEVGGTTPPVLELGAPTSTVRLGRGASAVLFVAPELVDEAALARAFAVTDGLTAIDARIILGSNAAVVVEGVAAEGAHALVACLAEAGIDAAVVADTVFKIPQALAAQSVQVEAEQVVLGFHTGPPLRVSLADIAGLAAGITRVERTVTHVVQSPLLVRRLERRLGRDTLIEETRVETLAADLLNVEMLVVAGHLPARRLRLATPPIRRDDVINLIDRCRAAGVPLGRLGHEATAHKPGRKSNWPQFNRARDLERDAIHAAWRAGRWPVKS